MEELVEHVERMRESDARYRRLNVRVRRALRVLERLLDQKARSAYLTLEEAVNERDCHLTDSVAQFAFALGHRTAREPTGRVTVRRAAVKSVLAELVYGWAEIAIEPRPPLTARDALDLITADGTGKRYILLRALFTLPNGNLMPAKDVVAKFLRKYKDRTVDGMCVTDAGTARTKTTLWVVRIVDRAPFDAAVSRLTAEKQPGDANESNGRSLPE